MRAAHLLLSLLLAAAATSALSGRPEAVGPYAAGPEGRSATSVRPQTVGVLADADPSPRLRKLPVVFEPNEGQGPPEASFIARGKGYALYLKATEVILSLASGNEVVMRFVGGNPDTQLTGREPHVGHSSFLRGSDPAAWVREVPHFGEVLFDDIYPGIDLVFHGGGGLLEYDFVVAPGADPAAISLEFAGADGLALDGGGNLELRVSRGDRFPRDEPLVMNAPVAFQQIGGRRHSVEVTFELVGESRTRFAVGRYDPASPLIIDPAIGFSTFLGGSGSDDLPRIALGDDGSIFVVGTTTSTDFPTRAASTDVVAFGSSLSGDADLFVARLDASGSTLLYSTYVGGSGVDRGTAIVVDDDGNAYVAGETGSRDFPVVAAVQGQLGGSTDAFVLKLTGDGSELLYATYLGGSGVDAGTGIAIDDTRRVYVIGQTGSEDFPTANALQPARGAPSDAFVARLDARGATLEYATYLGGEDSNDAALAVAVDGAGAAYLTGTTDSAAFPTSGAAQPRFGGGRDAFVAKLSPDGSSLEYATHLGGSGIDAGLAIALDSSGSVYVTGQTDSADFPLRRPLQRRLGGGADAFVSKLDPSGRELVYSTYLGGSADDVGGGIAVDGAGNAYVTGMTSSIDFPTRESLQPYFGGGADAFLSRINDLGTGFAYSTYFGGKGAEAGVGVVVDGAGNAYVAGQTSSSDFPTYNPVQGSIAGAQDIFVAKYCLSLIFPNEREFASIGGSDTVTVTTPSGCRWIASSNDDWITISSEKSGSGSGAVQLEVAANSSGRTRTGTVNIGGSIVTVTQRVATDCSYLIEPTSENFFGLGGAGRFRVITRDDCPWTAKSNTLWIQVVGGQAGIGSGDVMFRIDANDIARQRMGTISVAGFTFVVFDWIREPDR